MEYTHIVPGIFLERPNRFIAHVEIQGQLRICHVKNTGRCKELLPAGARVWCQQAQNPTRKTQFDLITVQKGHRIINMDSQAPNKAAAQWLSAGGLGEIGDLRPETRWGSSRFDFSFTREGKPCFLEVKGVTLEDNGVCAFPDAPTQRGVRHLQELTALKQAGYGAYVLFVIQMEDVTCLRPNDATDPAFGAALRAAHAAGVEILAVNCHVTPQTMDILHFIPILF